MWINRWVCFHHTEFKQLNMDKIVLVQFKIILSHSVHDVAADRCLEQVSLVYCQDVWWQAVPLFDGTME